MMPPSFGLLYLQTLKLLAGLAGAAVLAFLLASLGPAVWAYPPYAPRPRHTPPEGAGAVALFRAAGRGDGQGRWEAARAALEARFPPGSDASALVAFLTVSGPDRNGQCERNVLEVGARRYYCRVHYGSLVASVPGLDRWRSGQWVVGIALAGDAQSLERISVHVPLFGKG